MALSLQLEELRMLRVGDAECWALFVSFPVALTHYGCIITLVYFAVDTAHQHVLTAHVHGKCGQALCLRPALTGRVGKNIVVQCVLPTAR